MSVRLMSMLRYQLIVNFHVELTVIARDKLEGFNVFSLTVEGLARHPGGTQSMPSIMAVLDF